MGSVKLRESVLGIVGDAARNCPLPRHFFSMPNRDFTERIEAGSFYEINHAKLPIDAPTALYTLRAVMVTANTEQNVTIRYPSIQSLQAFFAKADRLAIRSKLYPATDEKYVMEPKVAVQFLGHQISSREFVEHRHSKSFWLINCSKSEQLGLPASMYGAADNNAKYGTCFSALQSCGMKWGFRQTQIVQSCAVKQPDDGDEAMSALSHGDDQDIVKEEEEIREIEVKLEETPDIKLKEIIQYSKKETPDIKSKEIIQYSKKETPDIKPKEIIQYSRKRKRGKYVRSQYRKTKRNIKRESLENLSKVKENKGERVDRWSLFRYEIAVKDMVEVLKANEASYSHPVSRATLRKEARKKIGDTGLLDHLLKHLAGKVVPSGGDERLRRRCAPDGMMEYWLESADLVNIRKEAGIQDPYWTPPPGWKSGDCVSSHNCICCEQVRLLKEELNSLRRKETDPKFIEDKQHTVTLLPENASSPGRFNKASLNVTNSKDSYETLAKKKSLMVEQIHKMSKALAELEEEMKKVKSQKGADRTRKPVMITYSRKLSGEEMSEESSERDDEAYGRGRPMRACRRVKEDVTVTPPTASPHSTTTS